LIYLVMMMLVAGIGIGSLMMQQRRQRAHMESVEGFRNSLSKIAPEATPGPFRKKHAVARPRPRGRTPGRPVPMDARRRAEARRRLEARRRSQMARAAASRNGF